MRVDLWTQRREHAPVSRRPSHIGGGFALSFFALWAWIPAALAGPTKVLSVGDGDTLTVTTSSGRVTVRLACIDAPESAQTPFGGEAREALKALAPVGASVTVQGGKRDRYGRTLAEIRRGNTNVNLELVRNGNAFAYRQYLEGCDRNAYLAAEKQAEEARRGVWSIPGGITRPWDWRHGGAPHSKAPKTTSTTSRSGRYRCADIGSWVKAQDLLKQGHGYLDGDGDGEACESLR